MQTIQSTAPISVPFEQWPDLANTAVGGKALWASDDFFASKEMMLNPKPPVFITDKYITQGKWMDGWESRRKRVSGPDGFQDQCLVQLGIPGEIYWINVDTSFFTGNYPEYIQIEALENFEAPKKSKSSKNPKFADLIKKSTFKIILKKSPLKGATQNLFPIHASGRTTHLLIRSFPDGGIARLRVHGKPLPQASELKGRINLAAITLGAQVVAASDMHYGNKDNVIAPGRAVNMGEGWETKRSRGRIDSDPMGYDWIIVKLAARAQIDRIEVDTHHYKGNFPHACSIELLDYPQGDLLACDLRDRSTDLVFNEVLPTSLLKADHVHTFTKQLDKSVAQAGATYLKLKIYPDGGVSRLRVFGTVLN